MANTVPFPFAIAIARMSAEDRAAFARYSDRIMEREKRRPWTLFERIGLIPRPVYPLRKMEAAARRFWRAAEQHGVVIK